MAETRQARKPSVFLDADVLIAGSASTTGASHVVLRLAELGLIDAVSSGYVRREVEKNLGLKLPQAIPLFRELADIVCRWVDDAPPARIRALSGEAAPKGLPVLAAAVEARCDTLLTFNVRDYRPQRGRIRVEEPSRFLERLKSELSRLAEPGAG